MDGITGQDVASKANRYVLIKADATVRMALQLLADAGGQEWWLLVIDQGAGTYRGGPFAIIRTWLEAGGPVELDVLLSERIESFRLLPVVELGADRDEAASAASGANAPAVVVIDPDDRQVMGVLVFNTLRSVIDPFAAETLLGLAGIVPQATNIAPPAPPQVPAPSAPAPLAPSPAPPAPKPAERSRDLSIDGDAEVGRDLIVGDHNVMGDAVSGDKVMGDKIAITVEGEKPKEMREQKRRFDVALPTEVHVGTAYELQVAVVLTGSPSPFGEKETKAVQGDEVAISTPVDPKTGELEVVDLEVRVTAMTGEVIGERSKKLAVYPDGRTEIRWFMLRAADPGKQVVRIEIEQAGRRVTEFKVENVAISPDAKPQGLLNLTLSIASFSFQLSFASG